jgi:hypothetical protein
MCEVLTSVGEINNTQRRGEFVAAAESRSSVGEKCNGSGFVFVRSRVRIFASNLPSSGTRGFVDLSSEVRWRRFKFINFDHVCHFRRVHAKATRAVMLDLPCPSVCTQVKKLESCRTDFHETWHLEVGAEVWPRIRVLFKSHSSNGRFTWRSTCVFTRLSTLTR